MGNIKDSFDSVFRDYWVEGIPGSGNHNPLKADIRAIGSEIESRLAGWRSDAAAPLSAAHLIAAKAIKHISAVGFTGVARGAVYRITVLARNDAVQGYNVRITDGTNLWQNGNSIVPPDVATGPVPIRLTRAGDARYFDALIDYRELLADGVAVNLTYAAAGSFELSDLIFRDEALRAEAALGDAVSRLIWRSPEGNPLTAAFAGFLSAILSVEAVGFTGTDVGADFRIIHMAKNDPLYGDRVRVAFGALLWDNGTSLVAGKDDGPVEITLARAGSSGSFKIRMDYRKLNSPFNFSTGYTSTTAVALSSGIMKPPAAAGDINPPWRAAGSDAVSSVEERSILSAIQKIEGVGVDRSKVYRLITLCRGHQSYGDRIIVWDNSGLAWTNGSPSIPGRADGPVWTTLTRAGHADYFNVLINYSLLADANGDGILLSNSAQTRFLLSAGIYEDQKLRDAIPVAAGNSGTATRTLGRALRVALAGSSITWGAGLLGQESYVGAVDDYLRYQFAETKHGAAFTTSGTVAIANNPLFFRGSATRLQNVAANASFDLTGDEVSLCIARPRGVAGAAICELLVNGVVHDTFSTLGNPITSHTVNFTGNGIDRKFDLGRAFTFGHTLRVNGTPIVVAMNTQGFGATIPPGADAMVIRGWAGGEVHHFLYFAVAPAIGAAGACDFSAGESITYMRGSVGQTTAPLTGANESTYGDGPKAYDPANPAALSAGLDFRGTDERSILTWRFLTNEIRRIQVRVKDSAPDGTGTPELWLNFATNRMHRIMNAGIGGKAARELLDDAGPVNIADVVEFQPDIVCIEFGTNDDWDRHFYRAWQTRTGLTAAQVRDVETANYYAAVRKIATDDYEVDDQRLPITAVTARSATFTDAGTTFAIVPGDAIIFGDFFGDNRRLAARVVKTWDAETRTVTWGRPLSADDMAGISALSDIATARVFGAPGWVTDMGGLIDEVRDALPAAQIAIGTCGIPNIRHRRLEGYRELADAICAAKNASFIDFYAQTQAWQYSQPATSRMYINAAAGTVSDGSESYLLYTAAGAQLNPLLTANWNLRGWSIKVNGVERINRGCHVYGGGKRGWPAATDPVTALSTGVQAADDYRLVFTSDVPPPGAIIEVAFAPEKWAPDDCHPAIGRPVMGAAVNAALDHLADAAAATIGRAA